jgi:hypothetical protein
MKIKKLIITILLVIAAFCNQKIYLQRIPAQRSPQQKMPEVSEADMQAFEQLLENMISEIEEEEEEEQKQTSRKPPARTPHKPQKTVAKKEVSKSEKIQKDKFVKITLQQLIKNFSQARQTIASLSSYQRSKFTKYESDLSKIENYLHLISEGKIYQNSLFDKKFTSLRQKMQQIDRQLSGINQDLKSQKTDTKDEEYEIDTEAEELEELIAQEAKIKQKEKVLEKDLVKKIVKKEAKTPQAKTINQIKTAKKPVPTTPTTQKKAVLKEEVEEKKEVPPIQKNPHPKPPLKPKKKVSWGDQVFDNIAHFYRKISNLTTKYVVGTWTAIINLFSKDAPAPSKPATKKTALLTLAANTDYLPANLTQKQTRQKPKTSPRKYPKKTTSPTLQKMALKQLQSLFDRELKNLNNQLKSVIDFSKKSVEEKVKKRAKRVEEAEKKLKASEKKAAQYRAPQAQPSQEQYYYPPAYQQRPYGRQPGRSSARPGTQRYPAQKDIKSPTSASAKAAQAEQTKKTEADAKKKTAEEAHAKGLEKLKDKVEEEVELKGEIIDFIITLKDTYAEKLALAKRNLIPRDEQKKLITDIKIEINTILRKKSKLKRIEARLKDAGIAAEKRKKTEWIKLDNAYKEANKGFEEITKIVSEIEETLSRIVGGIPFQPRSVEPTQAAPVQPTAPQQTPAPPRQQPTTPQQTPAAQPVTRGVGDEIPQPEEEEAVREIQVTLPTPAPTQEMQPVVGDGTQAAPQPTIREHVRQAGQHAGQAAQQLGQQIQEGVQRLRGTRPTETPPTQEEQPSQQPTQPVGDLEPLPVRIQGSDIHYD